ncbi:YnbE family lipoprotein [Sphingopyxis yananensis]|uniref:YnbE family lipoprotein n=1 Tax=Sphingopyxis yananensis TaxID=2886687 RepID=UPI001D129049|nr:YnbE family lipoprotein [Sphingopyxis yananensis]
MKEGLLALGGKNIVVAVALMSLAACVQIKAPDKPIKINLNIRINQEIVYKLDGDAKKLIDQNSGIF